MRSIRVATCIVTTVHTINGICIKNSTCVDVHNRCVEVVDEEVGRNIVIALLIAGAVTTWTIECRSLQFVDSIGNVSHDILRNSKGCVPCASYGIDIREASVGAKVVTVRTFICSFCLPILEVAVLIESSILNDVANVGTFANAGHNGILKQRPCKSYLGCQFFFAESASIQDVKIGTIGEVFARFGIVVEVLVEQIGSCTIEVISFSSLVGKSLDGFLEGLVSKVTSANQVRSTSQNIGDIHNFLEG